jgi:hypothetical protein
LRLASHETIYQVDRNDIFNEFDFSFEGRTFSSCRMKRGTKNRWRCIMIKTAQKIAVRAALAAMLVTTAAACAPTNPQQALLPTAATAPTNLVLPQHRLVACDAMEGTPGCHDGFMPYP